jgi:hypothetical protein
VCGDEGCVQDENDMYSLGECLCVCVCVW